MLCSLTDEVLEPPREDDIKLNSFGKNKTRIVLCFRSTFRLHQALKCQVFYRDDSGHASGALSLWYNQKLIEVRQYYFARSRGAGHGLPDPIAQGAQGKT
jgi:hypothetical protein